MSPKPDRAAGDMLRSDMTTVQQLPDPGIPRPTLEDLIRPLAANQQPPPQTSQVQFRRMYRYGLALLLIGVLCNWVGFAQSYFAPVRYLGVGCVLAGVLCICLALCRWMAIRHTDSSQDMVCTSSPSIHVITVPVTGVDLQRCEISKPPDYETVVGSCPPSYDEAIQATPSAFLQPVAPSELPSIPHAEDVESAPDSPPDPAPSFWRRLFRRGPQNE